MFGLSDSFGLRIRSGSPGCRLRQPGATPPGLPSASRLLACSPINMPTMHVDLKRRILTFSPHGMNYGFLRMLPQFGRAVQRNLSPRCRCTASKRQAAAEALQNVCSLRSGARELLSLGVPPPHVLCVHSACLGCTDFMVTSVATEWAVEEANSRENK